MTPKQNKILYATQLFVLGIAASSAFIGQLDLAVAGIAIFLIGQTLKGEIV